jgi:hypothetical protein
MSGRTQNVRTAKAATEATRVLALPWAPPERSAAEPRTVTDERPVFVSDRPWRKRAVAAATATGGALLLVWLLGVLAGALGLGHLGPLPVSEAHRAGSPAPAGSPSPEQARPHPSLAPRAIGDHLRSAGPPLRSGQRHGAAAPLAGTTRSPSQANAGNTSGESRSASKAHTPGRSAQSTPRSPEAAPSPTTTPSRSPRIEEPRAGSGAGGGSSRGAASARPETTPSGRAIPDAPTATPPGRARSIESNAGEADRRPAPPA